MRPGLLLVLQGACGLVHLRALPIEMERAQLPGSFCQVPGGEARAGQRDGEFAQIIESRQRDEGLAGQAENGEAFCFGRRAGQEAEEMDLPVTGDDGEQAAVGLFGRTIEGGTVVVSAVRREVKRGSWLAGGGVE